MSKERIAEGFRRWGYLQATLDSFGRIAPFPHRELDGFIENSVDEKLAKKWRNIYCGPIGAEFMYMPHPERCDWVAEQMEKQWKLKDVDRQFVLNRLMDAELFEKFIHTRYVGAKRFSLEGIAVMIPLIDGIIERAAELGVETVMLGMAHRGRLASLVCITQVNPANIFAAFEDIDPRSVLGGGDVKYHKGATGKYVTRSGRTVAVHMASNPSHLEAVNPVVTGRVRARQQRLQDSEKKKVLAVLLHGDAAFAGQGIVAETLNYAELRGFGIGGTIHIIVNNLIGFTAEPQSLHSTRYASDIARRMNVPIFHVNADEPDHVMRVAEMSADYRVEYKSDVVIDLIGFRRFGHNEADDPTTTSPTLYDKVKTTPTAFQAYAEKIGMTAEDLKALEDKKIDELKAQQEQGRAMQSQPPLYTLPEYWGGYLGGAYDATTELDTGVPRERLTELASKIVEVPKGFHLHPKIEKSYEQRREMALGNKPLDWGAAESLAFATLLRDGSPVRVVGQDARRATFNHRQSTLYDTKTGAEYIPLRHLHPEQGWFDVYDSQLSEAAAVGFEYGFSRDYPEALVCWEAQFGDFVNGAQIIIDQFITAGEDKWGLLSGMVMLLPHGFEGQGPEHSSARVERFLQQCAEDNIQVCMPSNAAQYFHLLRRQVLRRWRKPLVVFTPKSMLRLPAALSPIEDLASGRFQNVLKDKIEYPQAERIILCAGKVVHELRAYRESIGDTSTAILTLEQFYPFPEQALRDQFAQYPEAHTLVWVQEEPANMGGLSFVRPLLETVAEGRRVTSVKRNASASPATGSPKAHAIEQETLVKLAFEN